MKNKDIILISDTYFPLKTSGAIQLQHLAKEFVRKGYNVTVALPETLTGAPYTVECVDRVNVVRLRVPNFNREHSIGRALTEVFMPFFMWFRYQKSPFRSISWDGLIWYSPSIFHGFFASRIKQTSNCRAYLIVRDIFPEWAVDLGLLRRGLLFYFFQSVTKYQYSVADKIGIQTPGNAKYFDNLSKNDQRKIEVLENWLGLPVVSDRAAELNLSKLRGRKLFVYAGGL